MGKRRGKVRKGDCNFNHYFDIPREPNPLCFPNWACVVGNVASCPLTCGSQNYMYTVFTGLGLMFWEQPYLQLLVWVPCVTGKEGKCRHTIRDLRQNYHKTKDILTEFKVVLSLAYVNIPAVTLFIIWIKMSNKVLLRLLVWSWLWMPILVAARSSA